MRVLVVNPQDGLPPSTPQLLREHGWDVCLAADHESASQQLAGGGIDAVLVSEHASRSAMRLSAESGQDDSGGLYRMLEAGRVATVMLVDDHHGRQAPDSTLIDFAPRACAGEDLLSRLSTVTRYHRHLRQIETELEHMQRLGKRLNDHFSEVDQEMRLASRLQRDFLPKITEPLDGVAFKTIYRPASWVSGDIYDIFRVDESHVGCYVADAVGHGMAASLLTIFIKQAIVPKRIVGGSYEVLDPTQTLGILNEALAAQTLPNAQFVTACYALLNTKTLRLKYARAGHPYPLLFSTDGHVTELKSPGGLLGLFADEQFPSAEVQLRPGDKVLLYTDGFEMVFQEGDRSAKLDTRAYMKRFEALGHQPLNRMIAEIDALLDDDHGSLAPRDDISIVGFEIPTS